MADWTVKAFDEVHSEEVAIETFSASTWFGYQIFRLLQVKEWKIERVGLKRHRFGDHCIDAVGVAEVVYIRYSLNIRTVALSVSLGEAGLGLQACSVRCQYSNCEEERHVRADSFVDFASEKWKLRGGFEANEKYVVECKNHVESRMRLRSLRLAWLFWNVLVVLRWFVQHQ